MSRSRNTYLSKSADVLSRQVYGLFRETKKAGQPDAKSLKELCGVLKEAVSISQALEKTGGEEAGVRVAFDDELLPYTE